MLDIHERALALIGRAVRLPAAYPMYYGDTRTVVGVRVTLDYTRRDGGVPATSALGIPDVHLDLDGGGCVSAAGCIILDPPKEAA